MAHKAENSNYLVLGRKTLLNPDTRVSDFTCLLRRSSYKLSRLCLTRLMVFYYLDEAKAQKRRVARSRSLGHTC